MIHTVPVEAPVSDAAKLTAHGKELTAYLLWILGGTIVLLVIYLSVMDIRTSDNVDDTYRRVFVSIQADPASPGAVRAGELLAMLRSARQAPDHEPQPADLARVRQLVADSSLRLMLLEADRTTLDRCQTALTASPSTQRNGSLPSSAATVNLPLAADASPVEPEVAPGLNRVALLTTCEALLEDIRKAAGSPVDIERLRLMREFAKDIHEHHQSLRSFWISAAQLILVNVLLPLLTALLGYIFGRQASQSGS